MTGWNNCKNILCIRADNMGDLLMSSPAIRALKNTFNCKITLLTSTMGNVIAPFIEEIDETIVSNLPWIKTKNPINEKEIFGLINRIKSYQFDAAVIFTVYSQNPLPAAMLAYMAAIPRRLAYCRENPYQLLTDWIVEKEPFSFIQHQVNRDLNLVKMVNAEPETEKLKINVSEKAKSNALKKLKKLGVNFQQNWLILHPGVSETKREYPKEEWIKIGKLLTADLGSQLLITGSESEKELCDNIANEIGSSSFSLAGALIIEEFIALIDQTRLVISVNTGTVHIAAATQTPIIVLYALSNPQHTPWKVASKVLYFSVKEDLRSKNEVVNFVTQKIMDKKMDYPSPIVILKEAKKLLNKEKIEKD
jgi:lipopolysaccharide heptosyltransferase II